MKDILETAKKVVAMLEEKILPTTVERVAILLKHREKFSKIYTFMEEMQARLNGGHFTSFWP